MKATTVLFVILLGSLPTLAYASGTSGGFNDQTRPEPRIVDPTYERGKAVANGKIRDYGKAKVCVLPANEEAKGGKLKRKTLKPYRSVDVNVFATRLYICDQPELKAGEALESGDFLAVIYYLNKRFKLKLTRS